MSASMAEYRLPSDGFTVRGRLLSLAARGNKPFTASLHPGIDHLLGLRVPDVRSLAKEIAASDWRAYLADPGDFYMEERMLHGLVLGQVKVSDVPEYLELVRQFVARINSWSVCDTFDFAGKHRWVECHSAEVYDFLLSFIVSEREYEVRFAVVMLMAHFIDAEHWRSVVDVLETVKHQGYYVRMAIAWAMSVAFVKFPADMMKRMAVSKLDDWTFRKSVQKVRESLRAADSDKEALRQLAENRRKCGSFRTSPIGG